MLIAFLSPLRSGNEMRSVCTFLLIIGAVNAVMTAVSVPRIKEEKSFHRIGTIKQSMSDFAMADYRRYLYYPPIIMTVTNHTTSLLTRVLWTGCERPTHRPTPPDLSTFAALKDERERNDAIAYVLN